MPTFIAPSCCRLSASICMRLPTLTSKAPTVTPMSCAAMRRVSMPPKRARAVAPSAVPVPPRAKTALLSRANTAVACDCPLTAALSAAKLLPAVASSVLAVPLKLSAALSPSVSCASSATVAVRPDWMSRPASPSTVPRLQLLLELVMSLSPPTLSASVVKSKVSSVMVAPPPAVIARLLAETPPSTPITLLPLFRCTVVALVVMSLSNTRSPPSLRPTSRVAALTWPIEALVNPVLPRCSALAAVDWRMVTLPLPLRAVTALPISIVSPVRITSPVADRLPSEMSTVLFTSSNAPVALKL